MEKSYEEILNLLELMQIHPPADFVKRGSGRYLTSDSDRLESPAAENLIRLALEPREQPLYVMCLGCPTNVSAALLLEPQIREKVVVVWIGGQVHRDGGAATDFNIRQDLHASRALFDSGVALVQIVGYLHSEQMRTTVWELERFLAGRSALADYLFQIVKGYYLERRSSRIEPWSKPIWDLAVSGWLVNPDWVPTRLAPSPILEPDITWRLDPSRHPIRVSTRVERDPIFGDCFRKLATLPKA